MAKRIKRIEKGAESLKEEIEEHLLKLEKDIEEGNMDRGRYHAKEIDRSLLTALEIKMDILGIRDEDILNEYRERLRKLRDKLEGWMHSRDVYLRLRLARAK